MITFRPSSVRPSVRPCVRPSVRPLTFSNDFSSEAAEPILLKFHMEPPYMVKPFKNLLLHNGGCLGAESLHESSGTRGQPKLLKELSYVDV